MNLVFQLFAFAFAFLSLVGATHDKPVLSAVEAVAGITFAILAHAQKEGSK